VSGVSAPSAVAAVPDYNVIVDFGTPKAAGLIVCLQKGSQGCGEQFDVDATGVGRTNLPVGSWVMCVPGSDYLWDLCGNTPVSARTLRVTSTTTATTYRFTLKEKESDPVAASIEAMTWSKAKAPYPWAYSWSYTLDYNFAPSVKSPWIHARIVTQSGDVLSDLGKQRVERGSGAYGFSAGGGSATACGFVYLESSKRTVPVASLTLEVTASVPGGTRTYRSRAVTDLSACKKPLALNVDSVKITGARVGKKATASIASWPGVKAKYQWYVGDTKIKHATGKTYRVPSSAVARGLWVKVTAGGTGYRTATQQAAAVVKKGVLTGLHVPTLKGTARVGHTVTAQMAKPALKATYRYQWYADGKKVAGATSTRLRLKAAHAGKRISVTVTVSKIGYFAKKLTSAKSTRVAR